MLHSIKHINGSVLYSAEVLSSDMFKTRTVLLLAIAAGVCLVDANLRYADLRSADLRYADLRSADLQSANLQSADLRSADLQYANLQYADLQSANLQSAKNSALAIAQTRILAEGGLIGWKKCKDGVIVKLGIPAESKRSHAFGRKCRCEYAYVLEVFNGIEGISTHDGKTKYVQNALVRCDKWNENFTIECTGGIHFFITREEAEAY